MGALCDLMQSLENAVLVMSTVFKDDKAKLSKKGQTADRRSGEGRADGRTCKARAQDAKRFAVEKARELGVDFVPRALRLSWWNAVGQTCLRWRAS